jgi:glycosyltransferase involved in cell wall biosynthesis
MLRQCLDSIIRLSLRKSEREIIVVDDGSQVSPLGALNNYLEDIIYIRQKNGGLGCARNRGLQNATGQYIQFVDADDALITNQY